MFEVCQLGFCHKCVFGPFHHCSSTRIEQFQVHEFKYFFGARVLIDNFLYHDPYFFLVSKICLESRCMGVNKMFQVWLVPKGSNNQLFEN
jgi:hypothetical protein